MTKLRLNITMSLDGYVAGPNQSTAHPLGEGAEHLHDWLFILKTFRAIHGDTNGGETGTNDDVLREAFENIGATIMGRNMFGGGHARGERILGRVGGATTPPFHHPVFVLTHFAREPLPMQGGTTFFFVTDGIESALKQARRAANGKDVALGAEPKSRSSTWLQASSTNWRFMSFRFSSVAARASSITSIPAR
jgi:dihydrofolate reductase